MYEVHWKSCLSTLKQPINQTFKLDFKSFQIDP